MYLNPKMKLTEEEIKRLEVLKEKNKRHHNEILKMMVDIQKAFDKAQVKVILTGGSALGAFLYKGFIPWDDDADMGMQYKDYDKLFSIVAKYLPEKYEIISSRTHKRYLYPFPKIINKEIKLSKKEFGERPEFSYLFVDLTLFKSTTRSKQPLATRFWGKMMWLKNADVHWSMNWMMRLIAPFTQSFLNSKFEKMWTKQTPGKFTMDPNPYRKETELNIDFQSMTKVLFEDNVFYVQKDLSDFLIYKYKSWNDNIFSIPKKLITHTIKI